MTFCAQGKTFKIFKVKEFSQLRDFNFGRKRSARSIALATPGYQIRQSNSTLHMTRENGYKYGLNHSREVLKDSTYKYTP